MVAKRPEANMEGKAKERKVGTHTDSRGAVTTVENQGTAPSGAQREKVGRVER